MNNESYDKLCGDKQPICGDKQHMANNRPFNKCITFAMIVKQNKYVNHPQPTIKYINHAD